MSKQTAVEIVLEQQQQLLNQLISGEIEIKEYKYYASLAINQAKEMEKQQIIDAWEDGQHSFSSRNAEQYYNETFKD